MKNYEVTANDTKMSTYIEDILTHNYCPSFLRMSMVRESDDYKFSYKTDRYKRINVEMLNTYNKLVLLKSIINIRERNEDWLIKIENYMLESKYIYCLNNSVEEGSIRILYYPDRNNIGFTKKLSMLSEEITDKKDKREVEIFKVFREIVSNGDWNRAHIFLDKHILRLESQTEQKAC